MKRAYWDYCRNCKVELNCRNLELEAVIMTYRNYNTSKNIKWRVAVFIKKRFSFRLGNALLNTIC